MKKFILLLSMCMIFAVGVMSQTSFVTSTGQTSATLTNGDTAYLYSGELSVDRMMAIVAFADTLTGTDATITVVPEVWLSDRTGWAPLETAKTMITSGGVAEASVMFYYERTYFKKTRLTFIQTGTATTLVKADLLYRTKYK